MSELIQEEKFISYDNFIPNWTELVKEMDELGIARDTNTRVNYAKEKGYNYIDGRQCLVGEGHKGSREYANPYEDKHCDDCKTLSFKLASKAMSGGTAFDTFKRTFYDHMIDDHPDLMIKRD